MSQAISGMGRGASYGKKRKYTPNMASSIIARAVKKARHTPEYKSKFRLTIGKNINILPKQMRQTLVYSQLVPLSSVVTPGLVTRYNFRMNGMFDPDASGTGHQPMGYDQLAALYVRWVVIGCKMTVTCTATDATYYSGQFGVNVTDPLAGSPIDAASAIESMYSTYNIVSQAAQPTTCRIGVDIAKYFGVKDIVDDDALTGSQAADPTRQVRGEIWVASDQAAVKPFMMTVKIEYDALFIEPRNITSS